MHSNSFKIIASIVVAVLLGIISLQLLRQEAEKKTDVVEKTDEIVSLGEPQLDFNEGVSQYTNRELGLSLWAPSNWGSATHEVYQSGPRTEEEYESMNLSGSFRPKFDQLVTLANEIRFSSMACVNAPCVRITVYKYSPQTPYLLLGMDDYDVSDFRVFAQFATQNANTKIGNRDWYCTQALGPQSWTIQKSCEIHESNTSYRFELSYSPNFSLTEQIPEVSTGALSTEEFIQYTDKYPDLKKADEDFVQMLQSIKFL